MGTFFVYMLKTGLCLIAYYLFYKLLLSRETFHRFNRATLVGLLLLSFLIPLFGMLCNSGTDSRVEVFQSTWEEVNSQALSSATDTASAESHTNPAIALSIIIYLIGIAAFALRTMVSYISLARILTSGRHSRLADGTTLILTSNQTSPFSWLHYIVVNEEDYQDNRRAILMHELGHIHRHHTIDLLLTEAALILQWFNPAIWLIRRELQVIHEYEADEAVLEGGIDAKSYQMLLIKKAVGSRLQSITNCLHQSSIKKRITMMLKKKSNPWARTKLLLSVPVAALCTAVFTIPQVSAFASEIADNNVKIFFSGTTDDSGKFTAESVEVQRQDATPNPAPSATPVVPDDSPVFTVVETNPEFPGGDVALMTFVKNNLKYPAEAAKQGIQGRVTVKFIVEKDGSVSNIEVMRTPHELLSKEAIRIVEMMPKWEPGKQRGENVRVWYVMPITFRLQ
ncbi:MAG: M56 family metallopeptidase [Bacteroidales bacterium]|nr:M56 family metallopeptidase [Bacteroidales bacterium]